MTDQKYCRLCLKAVQAGFVLEEYECTKAKLIKLFPGMNLNLTNTPTLCLECLKSLNFISNVVNKGIELQQLGIPKPYLKTMFELCSICFKLEIITPGSVVSSFQVADLQKIIAVALFPLNSKEQSEVVVCNQCWYWIQKIYNFKKQCFEIEQSLIEYRQKHHLAVLSHSDVENFVTNKVLSKTNFPGQDNKKIRENITDNNYQQQSERVRGISEYCTEDTVCLIEESDTEDIGSLQQDNRKISELTKHNKDKGLYHNVKTISECCSEDTVSIIEEPAIEEIGCLKFEADETVILNTVYTNEESLLSFESTDIETTQDDVFVEDNALANVDSNNIFNDNCSDNQSTEELLIENDVADFSSGQRSVPLYHGQFSRNSICWGCYICETKYLYKKSIIKHILVHETPKNKLGEFRCHFCPFRTCCKGSLTVHKSIHKKCYKEKFTNYLVYYFCAFCNTTFESKTETQLHVGEHVKNFKDFWCTECTFSTDSPERLRGHFMDSHYKCRDRSFSMKQKLI